MFPLNGRRWLVNEPGNRAATRIFCLPFAGAGASVFRTWASQFPSAIEVCSVQLPGREGRIQERPLTRMPQLATALTEALLPHLRPPFVLAGHSLGALVAFEVARRLRALGRPGPELLIASACAAPHLPRTRPVTYNFPEPEFIAELKKFDGTPAEVFSDASLLQLLLPMVRADFEVFETYEYHAGTPLDCPIAAIRGSEDSHVTLTDQEAWRFQTRGDFETRVLPGNHFFIVNDPQSIVRTVLLLIGKHVRSAAA